MPTPTELIAQHRARVRAQQVFQALVSRAPNGMRLPHIRRLLPSMSEEQILEALDSLVQQQRVEVRNNPNQFVPGRVITSYALADPTSYPMRETIMIGGVEFPRAFHGDMAGAEDLNAFTEAIAEYDAKIEGRIADLAAALTRRYWANIATLFALFVAVFALILRAADPLMIQGTADPVTLVILSTARLLPLALILFVFAILMWLLLRRI